MAAGITFKIGGALDPSYRTALSQSVVEAKAANMAINQGALRMQRALQVEIAAMQKTLATGTGGNAIAAAAYNAPILLAIKSKEEQITHLANLGALRRIGILKAEAAASVAIVEAQQLAMLTTIATGGGARSNASGGVHGQGGVAGIVRESIVIGREIAMGRGGGRIAGSATILAQYLGLLNKAVKSTASEQLLASVAATKLSKVMAVQALQARGTAAFTELLAASQAQEAVAATAATEANIALGSATVTLNPIFFVIAGAIAIAGASAFFLWRHFSYLAETAKNLAEALNPLKRKYSELAAEQDKAAKAAKENADWIADLNNKHESESNQIERKIKLLKEEAAARRRTMEARGASDAELQALDRANLQAEKAMLEVQQARLKTENDTAQAAEQAASKAAIAGSTMTDEKGRIITIDQAQTNAKKRGDILDAAQEAMDAAHVNVASASNDPMHPISYTARPANETDVVSFKVGAKEFSMSVEEAKKNFNFMSGQARKLAEDQAHLDDVLKNAKSTATEKMDAQNRVKEDLESVNAELGIASSDPRSRRGGGGRSSTERERVGIGAPQVANLQKQSLDVSKMQLAAAHLLNSKMDRLIASGGGAGNPDGW